MTTPYDVGDTAPLHLTVNPYGDDTLAEVTEVRCPDGTLLDPPPLSAAGEHLGEWTAALPLAQAGLYVVTWTVTGTGAGLERDVVPVRPAPAAVTPGWPAAPPSVLYPS